MWFETVFVKGEGLGIALPPLHFADCQINIFGRTSVDVQFFVSTEKQNGVGSVPTLTSIR